MSSAAVVNGTLKVNLTQDFDVTESRKSTATTLNYNHLFSHGFNSLIINI